MLRNYAQLALEISSGNTSLQCTGFWHLVGLDIRDCWNTLRNRFQVHVEERLTLLDPLRPNIGGSLKLLPEATGVPEG